MHLVCALSLLVLFVYFLVLPFLPTSSISSCFYSCISYFMNLLHVYGYTKLYTCIILHGKQVSVNMVTISLYCLDRIPLKGCGHSNIALYPGRCAACAAALDKRTIVEHRYYWLWLWVFVTVELEENINASSLVDLDRYVWVRALAQKSRHDCTRCVRAYEHVPHSNKMASCDEPSNQMCR